MKALVVVAISGVVALFAFAAFAQLKAMYHFTKYMGSMTLKQRWSLSFLGAFALFWNRGLSDEVFRHRSLFFKWEGIFLLTFALIAAVDFGFRLQPSSADAKR